MSCPISLQYSRCKEEYTVFVPPSLCNFALHHCRLVLRKPFPSEGCWRMDGWMDGWTGCVPFLQQPAPNALQLITASELRETARAAVQPLIPSPPSFPLALSLLPEGSPASLGPRPFCRHAEIVVPGPGGEVEAARRRPVLVLHHSLSVTPCQ